MEYADDLDIVVRSLKVHNVTSLRDTSQAGSEIITRAPERWVASYIAEAKK